ncbi:hypothetical protein D3C83_38200 [compost metagenome]
MGQQPRRIGQDRRGALGPAAAGADDLLAELACLPGDGCAGIGAGGEFIEEKIHERGEPDKIEGRPSVAKLLRKLL